MNKYEIWNMSQKCLLNNTVFLVHKMSNEVLQKSGIPWRCAFPSKRKAIVLAQCYRSILDRRQSVLVRWLHPLAVLRDWVFVVVYHLQVVWRGAESLRSPPRELTPGLLKFRRGKYPSKNQCCGSRSASILSAGSGSRSRRAKMEHKKRKV